MEAAIREVDPRARFVSNRILRRIVRQESRLGVLGLLLAHPESLVVESSAALRHVDAKDLNLDLALPIPETLLLLENPDPADLEDLLALQTGWMHLFHARVHEQTQRLRASGSLDDKTLSDRIASLGSGAFAEITSVLLADHRLLTPDDPFSVYEEFVAVYLELRYFAPTLRDATFPSISSFEDMDAMIDRDLDGAALFEATRPRRAPAPGPSPLMVEPSESPELPTPKERIDWRSKSRFAVLSRRADLADRLGNVVRAAILRFRSADFVGRSRAGQARHAAEADLDRLACRLAIALDLDEGKKFPWRKALTELLAATGRDVWTPEAKLLFDLQKVCVDHEREIFTLGLIGWLISFGRRPLKRPLPNQRLVRLTRHLRSCLARLPRIRVTEQARQQLEVMIVGATHHAEGLLRDRLRPLIERSLDLAEFRPANLPESISFAKTTEDMLDQIVHSGFLTMGHLRDIVARGNLRQPDLEGPRDLLRGDRVLLADRRLRVSLDGVYHRGEIYLRWLQSASFLAFGTRIGRWLTLYLALPFGCSFGALVTVQEILHLLRFHVELIHTWSIVALGVFNFFLFHNRRFRNSVLTGVQLTWKVIRFTLVTIPTSVLRCPPVRRFLMSPFFDAFRRVVLQPFLAALLTFAIVSLLDRDPVVRLAVSSSVYVLILLLLLTPVGRKFEEQTADTAIGLWSRFRVDFLPGVIRLFMDVFDRFLQGVERLIYVIDERLRFRAGQGRLNLAAKAILGLVWGVVTYLIRIYINLLVEPQINPVKHFPTVTVAAKMIIPYLESLTKQIAAALWFLGRVPALGIAGVTVFFLPGLAGFVVWELKENWRLFEANRSRMLRPVMIGHHGETMRRLLCPGFHSGTIPKLHAKVRRTIKKAYRTNDGRAVRKAIERLHEAQESITHFVDRELIRLLVDSKSFSGHTLHCSPVQTATNHVTFSVVDSSHNDFSIEFMFRNDQGQLVASQSQDHGTQALSSEARTELESAIMGFFAYAGVEVIANPQPWNPSEPESASLMSPPQSLVFRFGPMPAIRWSDWVEYWERNRALPQALGNAASVHKITGIPQARIAVVEQHDPISRS